jgi:N-acetylglucosamine malate deacetylase 2
MSPHPLERLLRGEASVLIVVAHPDDETIGAGALISRLRDCRIVHVTDGAPRDPQFILGGFSGTREEYREERRRELAAAMALAGLGPERLLLIEGIAD